MKPYLELLFVLVVATLSCPAQSQASEFDGRQIEFDATSCNKMNTPECTQTSGRLRFLGNKVLFYFWDDRKKTFEDRGLVFHIGETLDIWSDEFGLFHDSSPNLDRSARRGTATSVKVGTDLFLIENNTMFFDNVSGPVHLKWEFLFRIPDSHTCEFVMYEDIWTFPQGAFASKFYHPWCKVIE